MLDQKFKYNITSNDGERTSVTVFIGTTQYIATKEHRNFVAICEAVTTGNKTADEVAELFDVTIPIGKKFTDLSERVSVNNGRIYFDRVPVDGAISSTILRFHAEGNENFMPLVHFMEKVETNPNPHSREHLFRWLQKHHFGIAPDGDIIAYKGVRHDDFSSTAGTGVVNGEIVTGHLANKPGTVIEMPRNEVTFDPRNGCSTGLHVANYSFARSFASKCLQVKVNPRDVVSVPVDASDQKMRVCRYKVIGPVQREDTRVLFPDTVERTAKVVVKAAPSIQQQAEEQRAKARAKPKAAKKPAPAKQEHVWPEHYEQFKKADFEACTRDELRWLAKEWEVTVPKAEQTKAGYIALLQKEARKRLRTWK